MCTYCTDNAVHWLMNLNLCLDNPKNNIVEPMVLVHRFLRCSCAFHSLIRWRASEAMILVSCRHLSELLGDATRYAALWLNWRFLSRRHVATATTCHVRLFGASWWWWLGMRRWSRCHVWYQQSSGRGELRVVWVFRTRYFWDDWWKCRWGFAWFGGICCIRDSKLKIARWRFCCSRSISGVHTARSVRHLWGASNSLNSGGTVYGFKGSRPYKRPCERFIISSS